MEILDRSVARAPQGELDPAKLPFGRTFSPNMFMVEWDEGQGWHDPRIVPYGPLQLAPSAMVLHYGQEIFEGLKAFRQGGGGVKLFRPDRNAARLNASARRMSMPEVAVELQLEAMTRLVAIDRAWVPPAPGSLYLRPAMIATEEGLGVHSSRRFLYFIITGPTGAYFTNGNGTVRIMVAREWVRAAPGGTGGAKTGGNYAASLLAGAVAKQKGCDQVLWLDAVERRHVEEVGAMNLVFVLDGVVTTPPTSGTILAGITRESIGVLCREIGLPFVNRAIHIEEVFQGLASGDCSEIFGCGTAAVVSPVGELVDGDAVYKVGDGAEGPVAKRLREALTAVQFGAAPDPHGWMVEV
ncbi:MAG: branched-chain amino acid aminotransferase [Thermoanaerobaculaceae bacterium]|nr:branched-chain amino acid aminotransferase [Thermoanaerobaculaceae bacterium]TAM53356.1 MAG: branched-chain amino acid aminotransferase [Acidobacteriota bacterium]